MINIGFEMPFGHVTTKHLRDQPGVVVASLTGFYNLLHLSNATNVTSLRD